MKLLSYEQESGQSMLELAVVLPVLALLVMSVFETGRALNQYLEVSHIVYEGARYGASLAGLEAEEGGPEATTNQMHDRIRSRVRLLLTRANYPEERTSISTHYEGLNPSADLAANSITVAVQISFDPIFPVFQGLAINVEATAPYLFKDENL